MGQLMNLPVTDSRFDRRPKTLSECVVNGKLDARLHLQYKKRSNEDVYTQVADLLFRKSLLQAEDEERAELLHEEAEQRRRVGNKPKKRRKEKQVVMYTDMATGLRCRLSPTMSLW